MNRNDEFLDLMNELNDTPAELENTVRRAQARARRRRVPVRVLIAAACVAAALAVGAVAIEMTTPRLNIGHGAEILPPNVRFADDTMDKIVEENRAGYTVTGTARFDWSKASKELRDAVAQAPEHKYRTAFDSQAELEEFLGFSLPENSVLAAGEESWVYREWPSKENPEETIDVMAFALLYVYGEEETGPTTIDIETAYTVQAPDHTEHMLYWYDEEGVAHYEEERPSYASYRVCTDEVRILLSFRGNVADYSMTWIEAPDTLLTEERYVTPGGREVVIIVKGDSPDWERYRAYFTLDGMTVELSISDNSCKDVKGILYAILDAYDTSR